MRRRFNKIYGYTCMLSGKATSRMGEPKGRSGWSTLLATFTSTLPKFALKVRARSIPGVAILFFDFTVSVEIEYIDALPTESFSNKQASDDSPEEHNQPSRLGIRDIMSTYIAYRHLAILNIDYPVMLVESHRTIRPLELRLECRAYLRFPPVSFTVTGLIDCVIAEACHNGIQVVGVEGVPVLLDRFNDLCGRLRLSWPGTLILLLCLRGLDRLGCGLGRLLFLGATPCSQEGRGEQKQSNPFFHSPFPSFSLKC